MHFIISSVKEVMFYPAFVCLSVYPSVSLLATLLNKKLRYGGEHSASVFVRADSVTCANIAVIDISLKTRFFGLH